MSIEVIKDKVSYAVVSVLCAVALLQGLGMVLYPEFSFTLLGLAVPEALSNPYVPGLYRSIGLVVIAWGVLKFFVLGHFTKTVMKVYLPFALTRSVFVMIMAYMGAFLNMEMNSVLFAEAIIVLVLYGIVTYRTFGREND